MTRSAPLDLDAVAVIGMAGRFPGASSVAELWRNQLAGIESITFFTDEELAAAGIPKSLITSPDYVPARGALEHPELFDADFFGLSPREAEVMDPQIRHFLECAWHACEDAGYDIQATPDRVGVYAGSGMSTYFLSNLQHRPDLAQRVGAMQIRLGNSADFLPTWAAYKLNLKGPAVAVQTACSTSLAAVHFACQAVLDGECSLALAGGVSIPVPLVGGYPYQEGGVASPDGHCRTFDAEARGSVPGSGVGVVVLKGLGDALADGDDIRAVIRATAISNDGAQRVGFTAPGVEGQVQVIAEALALADVPPETVRFVEAHGSGTSLGDPIEMAALNRVFGRDAPSRNHCAVASIKSAIGHLDSAAGVAGLIRTVCGLQHKTLPPSLNFERPNEAIDFSAGPFYVNTKASPWPTEADTPRRAGVSSFGIGGTNVHAVLEEAPPVPASALSRPWQHLVLSARSESALEAARVDLLAYLRSDAGQQTALADVAYTLKVGRRPFRRRWSAVCRSREQALEILEGGQTSRRAVGVAPRSDEPAVGVAFLLSGLGDQHPNMTLGLYRHEPTFREAVDRCAEILQPTLGLDLREVIYPSGTEADVDNTDDATGANDLPVPRNSLRQMLSGAKPDQSEEARRLGETWLAHPAIFVVEYALAQLLDEWGIQPRVMLGYSLGEIVAACLAGVFSLPDALGLVAERARLIQSLDAGSLLAVPLSTEETQQLIDPYQDQGLELSAANGAALTVVGGPPEAVEALAERLESTGVACRFVQSSHAFHTAMMEPIRQSFVETVARVEAQAPKIPFVSNVTGTWIRDDQATDPAYWGRHLIDTVRFADGVGQILARGNLAVVEVGPGASLATLVRQHEAARHVPVVLSTLPDRGPAGEQAGLLMMLGRLWVAGVELNRQGFYRHEDRRRVPLPTYPFERRRYWVEPGVAAEASAADVTEDKPADLAQWFYRSSWQRGEPLRRSSTLPSDETAGPWLLFVDDTGLGQAMADRLRRAGQPVVTVESGDGFVAPVDAEGSYRVAPRSRDDYSELLRTLEATVGMPIGVVHLWSVPAPAEAWTLDALWDDLDELLARGLFSVLYLTQALGEHSLASPVEICVISSQAQDVTGQEGLCPPKAAMLGLCRVIPQEFPSLRCRAIDVDWAALTAAGSRGRQPLDRLAGDLVAEVAGEATQPMVAYRGRHRWVQVLEEVPLEAVPLEVVPLEASPQSGLRQSGVYLITGAETIAGLVLAEHLANVVQARLVLVVPPGFPPVEAWSTWRPQNDDAQAMAEVIPRLDSLRSQGVDLLVQAAEISDLEAMSRVVTCAVERFGELHGVVHAASAPAAGLIQFKQPVDSAPVLAPKVAGTLALAKALSGVELDFLALFSSTSTVLGGIGQVDACVANSFVDAFSHYRAATQASVTVAIGWDAFRWSAPNAAMSVGLSADYLQQIEDDLERFGVDADECVEIFGRALDSRLSHVYASGRPLPAMVRGVGAFDDGSLGEMVANTDAEHHPRPELTTTYREPSTETEATLLALWQEALGIEIGVDDNFFELDGNSLLAIQIVTRLRSAFEMELAIGAFFEFPTVALLAAEIDRLRDEAADIEALLAEIEGVSGEEAEQLLAAELEGAG